MADIPDSVKAEILRLEPQIRQIAGAQNLHPAVIPVLWGKEGGWARSNPENGECLFGFYSRRLQGNLVCPDPSTDEGLLRQFEMAVEEFRRHAERRGISLTANSSLEDYAEAYMEYNGNIDCYGNPYSSWREHPYVMNGYDSAHRGMVARSGQTDVPCISLQVIGAVPAHIRVAELLGED